MTTETGIGNNQNMQRKQVEIMRKTERQIQINFLSEAKKKNQIKKC